ncbi:MFS transporter [Nocardia rhamnosiphila]|uniref:MFS transporter n=1 Tax=Nocardia rhamnosiphila TaxID=426716 RepID=UPI0033DF11C3
MAPLVRSRGDDLIAAAPTTVSAGGPAAPTPSTVRRVLPLCAIAAALSATGNNAVASYFVELGHHAGLASAVAANLLSVSAVIAVGVRIVVGLVTDRTPRRNPTIVAAMMFTGAAGLALIATGTPTGFLIGAILAFAAGWGWTGLLLATTLRLVPDRAEQAGHTVQVGIYTGAAIAPFTFSTLSTTFGFDTAALIAATAGLAATALLATGAKLLHRESRTVRLTPRDFTVGRTEPLSHRS